MAGVVGDFAELDRLRKAFEGLSRQGMHEVSKVLAAEALHQLDEEFEESRDPYNRPWAPPKRRKRGTLRAAKPLIDTGRMRSSFHARPRRGGFVVSTDVRYAGYHQKGTRRMVKRQMLPEKRLGPRWAPALEEAAREWRRQRFGR